MELLPKLQSKNGFGGRKMRLIDVDRTMINFGFEWDDITPTADEFYDFLRRQLSSST